MKTVKGIYDNGEITMLENVPVTGRQTVLITFIDNEENDNLILRQINLQNPASLKSYLEDENEDLYQDYLI